ncbi:9665_t:CDS:2, partial [Funneliformis caledonium]
STTNPVKHTREIDDELYFSVTSMLCKKPDSFINREDLLDYIKRPFISAIDIFQLSYDRYFQSELPQEILNNFFYLISGACPVRGEEKDPDNSKDPAKKLTLKMEWTYDKIEGVYKLSTYAETLADYYLYSGKVYQNYFKKNSMLFTDLDREKHAVPYIDYVLQHNVTEGTIPYIIFTLRGVLYKLRTINPLIKAIYYILNAIKYRCLVCWVLNSVRLGKSDKLKDYVVTQLMANDEYDRLTYGDALRKL